MKASTPRKKQMVQQSSNNTPVKKPSIGSLNKNQVKNQNIQSNNKNQNIQSNNKNQNIQSNNKKSNNQSLMIDLNESRISTTSSNKSNKNLDTTIVLFNAPADRIVIQFWSN